MTPTPIPFDNAHGFLVSLQATVASHVNWQAVLGTALIFGLAMLWMAANYKAVKPK